MNAKARLERESNKFKKGNIALDKTQLQTQYEAFLAKGDATSLASAEATKKAMDQLDDKTEKFKKRNTAREEKSYRIEEINRKNARAQQEVIDTAGQQDLLDQIEISAGRTRRALLDVATRLGWPQDGGRFFR
mgnify:CR=1 FL=1